MFGHIVYWIGLQRYSKLRGGIYLHVTYMYRDSCKIYRVLHREKSIAIHRCIDVFFCPDFRNDSKRCRSIAPAILL